MSRNKQLRDRARELRREMTPAEALLWKHLRGRRLGSFKFRRQHPVDPFIPDFYCAAARLGVEADGESHLGREARDQSRDRWLRENGMLVLRFWNTDIHDNTEGVLQAVYEACLERTSDNVPSDGERSIGPLPVSVSHEAKAGRSKGESSS